MNGRKVAIQLISTGGIYGAERALLELAGYMATRGWDSHVVALEGRGATDLVTRAAALGLAAEAFVPSGRMGFVPMLKRARQLLGRYPRAIVHSHGYKPDILLSLLAIPRRLACVATCHSWYSETRQLRVLEVIDKRVLRGFDRVVAVSGEIAEELRASGVAPQKVVVIRNGISAPSAGEGSRMRVRAQLGVSPDSKLIVQIGRLARSKRNDLLLAAVASLAGLPDVHVLLVGEGDQARSLAEIVSNRGLTGRVHFSGYREDIPEILAAADLLAVTSDKEGLPIVILEAMAMRCAIVATGVGEIPKVLCDGREAWLVPPNDVGALAQAIREILTHPDVVKIRVARAHEQFLREYSRDSMGSRYLEIYDHAWARRGWL
jgi:glycosyltransferase involved in cell wall biosynthesis